MQFVLMLMIVSLPLGALCQAEFQTSANRRRPQTQMSPQISLSSIIPSNSQYTEGKTNTNT